MGAPKGNKLTDKQERFCQEYMRDLNATQAAKRAGYSDNTANEQGSQNLAKLNIQERISELKEEIAERNRISVDELVSTLAGMVRFDIAELYNEDGDLKLIHQIDKEQRAAISSLETDETMVDERMTVATRKVRTYSKLDAIEKLMKHLGGYEKDNEQKISTIRVGFE